MKKKHKFSFLYIIIAVCSAIICVILLLLRDPFVIQFGIRTYEQVRIFFILETLVFTIMSVYIYVCSAITKNKDRKVNERKTAPKETGAILSVSKELDPNKLYTILTEYASHSNMASEELLQCAMQLKTMDIYQEKLAKLLQNNGATSLDDTQEVLDKVEQYLCKAVRKVINYIDVSDQNSEEDSAMILNKLNECFADCQAQLEKVKEFLLVLAEFLNKQGSDDTTPETLDMYKQCILKSINDEL